MAKRAQNRGPYILAAGAAAQLLTGIPAAWGVFQQPVMQGYGFSRGQAMLAFAVLVAAYGVGCAMGGLLQDAHGPRFAGLWGTALLAGGFFAASLVPVANAVLFLLVYSLPAGLGSAFLAPAVLACAQKWYKDKKGWATGVTGVAMGLSGAFFTLFVKGVGGAWGIRVCFAALGAVMLVICGAGALILQDPPAPATSGNPQPGLDWPRMVRTTQYKLCVAAVALSAPAVLLFSPEIFKIATERGLPEAAAPCSIVLGSAASAAGRLLLPACSGAVCGVSGPGGGVGMVCFCRRVVGAGGLCGADVFLLRRGGGAACIQYRPLRPAPRGGELRVYRLRDERR